MRRTSVAMAIVLLSLIASAGGCAPGPLDDSAWPEARPLGRELEAYRPPRAADAQTAPAPAPEEPTGALTLREALAAALLMSPDLAATAYEVRAREAESLQAGRLPNPELELELENFGGSGPFSGFDGVEMTLSLGQVIELGGKRTKRQRVAELESSGAGWAYEMRRIDVLTKTAADYVAVLAARRRLELAADTTRLARRVSETVGERVDAGKVSPLERAKAGVELSQARLREARAERALTAARIRLASNWGGVEPHFTVLAGDLDRADPPPPFEAIADLVDGNPDVALWAAEASLRQAEIELALAQRVPDLTATGGVRYFNEIDETVFVAGLSMPIPVFDRNEGGVEAARLRSLQGEHLREAARLRTRTALAGAYQQLDAAFIEVRTIRDDVLPSAELAFDAAEEAFRQGKIGALDLLDAERTLFDARRQLVDALSSYHLAEIAAERLIGAPLRGDETTTGEDR